MKKHLTGETVLVTGMAGFIGHALAKRLLAEGFRVVGVDNLNDYYEVGLKHARLRELGLTQPELDRVSSGADEPARNGALIFYKFDLNEQEKLQGLFRCERPAFVVHLAAQAGVRYSLKNPHAYVQSNISGFLHILEGCRAYPVRHLVYASSSSVYGANRTLPYSVRHNTDHPLSLYAASKKTNELMAHAYSHLFHIPTTGLRFFTVYGPWGRPDMALFLFTRKILAGEPIEVYNNGRMKRDFTYIDDTVEGLRRVLEKIPAPNPEWSGEPPDPASSPAPYRLFNIGSHRAVGLIRLIEIIEQCLDKKSIRKFLPLQPGDVEETCAEIADLHDQIGFYPRVPLVDGVRRFIEWFRNYYRV